MFGSHKVRGEVQLESHPRYMIATREGDFVACVCGLGCDGDGGSTFLPVNYTENMNPAAELVDHSSLWDGRYEVCTNCGAVLTVCPPQGYTDAPSFTFFTAYDAALTPAQRRLVDREVLADDLYAGDLDLVAVEITIYLTEWLVNPHADFTPYGHDEAPRTTPHH